MIIFAATKRIMVRIQDKSELRGQLVICDLLSDNENRLLLDSLQIAEFRKNQIIYSEGEKPDFAMCLLNGKVKVTKSGVGSRNHIVRMVKPSGYFAYRGCIAEENHSTTASAFEACRIALIPAPVLLQLIRQNNALAWFFIQALAVDLGVSDSRQVNLTQKHIRGRLAESLLLLRDHYGLESDGVTINIYLSREDLANMSNMTTSNAIRTLSMFVEEKVISIDGRRIKIIDEDQLSRISRLG